MADVYLSILTNKPGSAEVVLINGEPSTTGYKIDRAGGVDLGSAAWDKTYSGARGTQGAKLVGATAQNRLSTWTLQVIGTSEDDLQAKLSVLWNLDEDLRRYGGTAYWRSWGSSFLMELEVLDSGVQLVGLDPSLWVLNHRINVQLGLVTPPYMSGPWMDLSDDFSTDSVTAGDYTFDALTAANVNVTGGQLTSTGANSTVERRLIHTASGYLYRDVQATIAVYPTAAAKTSAKAGVVLFRTDALNYFEVYVDDNGTNSRLRIDQITSGSRTNRATTNLGSRLAVTPGWVRGRSEGANIYAEFFTSAPTPMASPTTSTSYATGNPLGGSGSAGSTGIVWNPQGNGTGGWILDDFKVEPFTYRNIPTPVPIYLNGTIPGDVPALLDAYITPSGGSAAPVWASLGWWPRVPGWNRVWNGDFENAFLATKGWSVAAVTNMNGAATSIARITTAAQYGTCSGQIVAPATADTGANFRIFYPFRKGFNYTLGLWVHSAAGTTNVYARIGNAAANDKATSPNFGLTSTWQQILLNWTPTADYDDAHIAVNIAAATATTFEIDGVTVSEGQTTPTTANQTEGRGGFPPIGLIEAENQAAPSANANFRSGFGTGTGASPSIVIDPALLTPDDYGSNTVAVEVWARVELVAGSSATAVLQAGPISSSSLQPIYSEEFGAAGKVLSFPSAGTHRRLTRLGTLRIPTDAGRYVLQVPTSTAGTAPNWDYLLLLPSNARALSPSGRANDTSYPDFVPVPTEVTRRIRSDLSGTLKEPATGAPESSAPSLGGSLLELPPDDLDAIVKLSSMVPDDPTASATDEQTSHSATIHFAVRPRWRLGRSS